MGLTLVHSPLRLELKNPFKLAHGSSDSRTNILVQIGDGLGELPIVPYYGRTYGNLTRELDLASGMLGDDPEAIGEILDRLNAPGARLFTGTVCAIDLALHDHLGKKRGLPLHRLLGLKPKSVLETSFTIALDEPEAMARRARESGLPLIKVKLGGGNDFEAVKAIRRVTTAKLRLDANGGWSRDQALEMIPRLMDLDIELIEQPLVKEDIEGYAWLRSRVRAPIFADESLQTEEDLVALAPGIEGVVIKLMKSGGIRGALRMIELARKLELKVMLSCMVESSLGVTAAAHLGGLADFIDLDGPLLIKNDPFRGIQYDGARITLPKASGLGVKRALQEHAENPQKK